MSRSYPLLAIRNLAIATIIFFQVSSALGQVVGFDAFRYENRYGGTWGAGVVATPSENDFINFTSDGTAGGIYVGQASRSIDPANYELQVTFRLGDNNQAIAFSLEARQDDGDDGSTNDDGSNIDCPDCGVDAAQVGTGLDLGENFQWNFPDMDLDYADAVKDADGFVTLTKQIWDPAEGTGIFDGTYKAWGYEEIGDGLMDWNAYEGGRPNSLIEMQFQAAGDGLPLDVDVKSVLFVPTDPNAPIAVFDQSGISGTFGAATAQDGDTSPRYSRGDGSQFTNVELDFQPIGGDGSGGAYIHLPPSAVSIDGNEHSIEVTAKLLPDNTATQLAVEILDVDGYAPDIGEGRDEFVDAGVDQMQVVFDITQLNDQTMTTLTLPISDVLDEDSASWISNDITAWGAEGLGDGDIASLDIYQWSVNSIFQTAERLNIEIESIKIVSNDAMTSLACDFDGDADCDMDDINALYSNWGAVGGNFDVDGSGNVDAGDIGAWLTAASSSSNPANAGSKTFVLGDVNLDGSVNSTDLGLLLNNFGDDSGMLFGAGNLNDDANINSTDLGLLLNNFGQTSASASAVPEPSAISLLLLSMVGLLARARRRR